MTAVAPLNTLLTAETSIVALASNQKLKSGVGLLISNDVLNLADLQVFFSTNTSIDESEGAATNLKERRANELKVDRFVRRGIPSCAGEFTCEQSCT